MGSSRKIRYIGDGNKYPLSEGKGPDLWALTNGEVCLVTSDTASTSSNPLRTSILKWEGVIRGLCSDVPTTWVLAAKNGLSASSCALCMAYLDTRPELPAAKACRDCPLAQTFRSCRSVRCSTFYQYNKAARKFLSQRPDLIPPYIPLRAHGKAKQNHVSYVEYFLRKDVLSHAIWMWNWLRWTEDDQAIGYDLIGMKKTNFRSLPTEGYWVKSGGELSPGWFKMKNIVKKETEG